MVDSKPLRYYSILNSKELKEVIRYKGLIGIINNIKNIIEILRLNDINVKINYKKFELKKNIFIYFF